MKAAERAADVPTKMQLLSHSIIDFPRRDSSRVPLFEAAIQAGSDGYALGILEPLLQTQFLRNPAVENSDDEDQISGSVDEEENKNDTNFLSAAGGQLSRIQAAQLAQMIADAMSRQGRLGEALSYYQTARTIGTSPLRKVLADKIAETKSTLSIELENASRQPLLHEALEQDRVVRPRLLAHGARASRTSAAKGDVKQ